LNRATLSPTTDERYFWIAFQSKTRWVAAARALLPTAFDAEEIVRRAMAIAASICVYTNSNLVLESL